MKVLDKTRTADQMERLHVSVILAHTGWKCTTSSTLVGSRKAELFVALHDKYPMQMALTLGELVRRCWWQEDHRLVPLESRPDAT